METATPQSLYVEKLKDLYSAVMQVVGVLPRMAKVASTPQLREALTDHLHQTQVHLHRLDKIFLRLGVGPRGRNCTAMETMIAETRHLMGDGLKPAEMDAALIAAVQRFEQYEASEYASLHASAEQLGHTNAAASLQESVNEQAATGKKLARLAEPVGSAGVPSLNGKH